MHEVRPVKVSAVIPASPNTVLAFISDTRNDPLWCPNVESAEMTSSHPIGEGSTFRYHQHLDRPGAARVEFDGDVTITALEDASISWHVSDRFQERTVTCSVEPVSGGTRVTQTTIASFHKPPGLAKYLYPLLAKRTLKAQLGRLVEHFTPAQH